MAKIRARGRGALYVSDGTAPGGNYVRGVARISRALMGRPGLFRVRAYHDDWCGVFAGQPCDCAPDFDMQEWKT